MSATIVGIYSGGIRLEDFGWSAGETVKTTRFISSTALTTLYSRNGSGSIWKNAPSRKTLPMKDPTKPNLGSETCSPSVRWC